MGDNTGQGMRSVNRKLPANLTPGIVLIVLAAIALLIIFSTSFIVVDQTERAVITTFGKFTSIAQPGLTFKWPFGIQKAYHVKTEVVQTEQFGFRTDKPGIVTQYSSKEYPEESTMLTGDLNIINVEWIIQYRITDPKAWLFNVSDKQKTIRDISQAVSEPSRGGQDDPRGHRAGAYDDPRSLGPDDEREVLGIRPRDQGHAGPAPKHRPAQRACRTPSRTSTRLSRT